jgi:ABC-type Mn2+/Zn2+ transport system ATPase subunit
MNGHELISASNVRLGYGSRTVLTEVSFVVRRGDFWFFLGPNGQGKTTLLRAVLGLIQPAAGSLRIAIERARVGFVPQRCDLNPSLPTTVREFVTLGLAGIRTNRAERAERLQWALEQVGLDSRAKASYWALSGGQRQRALLARALVRKPELLILDEPTNGLDLSSEDALLRALARLNASQHLTALFVTHDLAIAARYATHVALFQQGRVVSGPRAEVLATEQLIATYGVPVHMQHDARGGISVAIDERSEPLS